MIRFENKQARDSFAWLGDDEMLNMMRTARRNLGATVVTPRIDGGGMVGITYEILHIAATDGREVKIGIVRTYRS